MMRSHQNSIVLILLSVVACTSLAKEAVLQTVELTEADHFLEGAGFNLTKDKNGCVLRGVGYSESGKREYVFRFNNYGIKTAHYIESRYAVPIYIDNFAPTD